MVIGRRWQGLFAAQAVHVHLGDEIARNRRCDEQERHHQNLVDGPVGGVEGIDHRRQQKRPDPQCRGLGGPVQARHAIVQLDQPDGANQGKERANHQQCGNDAFGYHAKIIQ